MIKKIKNKLSLVTLLLLSANTIAAPIDDFVITIQSDNPGTSADTAFMIPTIGGDYNYNVDCNNDGINEATAQTANYTCDYSTLGGVGTYTIRIKDNSGAGTGFPRISFNDTGDKDKIIDLQQWGTGQWQNMRSAFSGASNLFVSAVDMPDFSMVSNMKSMFSNTNNANPDTSNWNTSSITDMDSMFNFALVANPDTSNWDTSLVITMKNMFDGAIAANPNTSNWDTSGVTNMGGMFRNANVANPDTSTWDTSLVTNMSSMFLETLVANPDTSSWDTSSVEKMGGMFNGAVVANPDTSNWDTSWATNMGGMFRDTSAANPDTSLWDTSSVTNMNNMFKGAIAANPDTSNWDTSSVTEMVKMFNNASIANPDTSNWDVSELLDATDMFKDATLPTVTYDALLNNWGAQSLQNGVPLHAGNSYFCNGEVARNNMINTFGWIITDDGQRCSVDISMTKILDTPAPYSIGDSVQYTLLVSNNGPDVATDVLVNDTPTNLTITSVNSPNCTVMPCTIASMANAAVETITIIATINTSGAFDNSASANATQIDPDSTNNTDNSGGVTSTVDCSVQPWLVDDELGLNDAIICYNDQTAAGNYTISLTQNINLTASSIGIDNINTDVTLRLDGNNFTVDGQDITLLRPFELDANTTATFQNITIIGGNAASIGAGILNGGTLIVNNSTIRNNSVGEDGGGIFNRNNGMLTINNSTIHNNSAGEDGGGIDNRGTLTINNSTVHNNTAGVDGGGIINRGTLAINNSTIEGNSSASGATGVFNGGTLMISNTIIDNAIAGNDCLAGSNYNLLSNVGSTCGLIDGVDGNIIGQAPLLATLQDNGGSTFTQALLPGSPAINAGDPAYPTTGYDQRGVGFDRVTNGRLDIGAYETPNLYYTIGGTLTGLAAGSTVTLQNNTGDDLTVNSDGSFTFATAIVNGSNYAVTVLTQPSFNQICTVNNNSGQLNGADVVDIAVNCTAVSVVPVNVPTLNNWTLVLLILLMLSVVGLQRRYLK